MAILCAVGDGLRGDPRLAVRLLGALDGVPLRMVSQAASRRNITVVMSERDSCAMLERCTTRCSRQRRFVACGPARRAMSPAVMPSVARSSSATDEWGSWSSRLRPSTAARSRASSNRSNVGRARRAACGADVAIDFSTGDAVPATSRQLAARGIDRRHRHDRLERARGGGAEGCAGARHRRRGGPEFRTRRQPVRGDGRAGGGAVRAARISARGFTSCITRRSVTRRPERP